MIRQIPPDEAMKLFAGGPLKPEPRDGRSIVLFETLWKHPADGWAIASRAYARALFMAGVDVRLKDWQRPNGPVSDELEPELRGFNFKPPIDWDLHVYSAPLVRYSKMDILLANLAEYKSAFYCVFERRRIEPETASALNGLSGVWVQCSMNRDVLAASGVRNIGFVRYPYFDDDPLLKLESPRQAKTFLYIGRFEPRKCPENILRAFMRAFKPGEATLIMKLSPLTWTFSFESTSPESAILYELVEPEVVKNGWTAYNWQESIRLVRGRLSAEEMVKLHASADVYVSASRGEGLDLPSFAAKLAGRRLLTVASGGPEDFAGEGDIIVKAAGMIDADERYDWGPGACYVDYKLEDLIAGMQTMRGRPVGNGRDWPMKLHRAEAVGKALKQFFEECAERKNNARSSAHD